MSNVAPPQTSNDQKPTASSFWAIEHILRPHAGGQERLMPIAKGDVGDEDGFTRSRLNGKVPADEPSAGRRISWPTSQADVLPPAFS